MPLAVKSVRIALTQSGIIDSDYPDGVEPGAPLNWGPVPNFSAEATGVEELWDVRQYLFGEGADTAPIALFGTVPAGWSIPDPEGDLLRYVGTTADSGVMRLSTTGNVVSNEFSVHSSVPASTDTLPPTQPTRLEAKGISGGVEITFDQCMDPHTGAVAGSQID